MTKKKRKTTGHIEVSKEELIAINRRNEKFRKKQEYVARRIKEINKSDGIIADWKDIVGIKTVTFWAKLVVGLGNFLQAIQNIANKEYLKQRNSFWYDYVYPKYNIPTEVQMGYTKGEDKKFRFKIPTEENETK